MPAWIIGISIKAGFVPEFGARITVGLAAALAGILLALGRRGRVPAILVAGLVLFSGVADLSASLSTRRGHGSLPPTRTPDSWSASGILGILLRTKPDPKRLRHPLMAGFGVVAALVLGSAIAANVDVAMEPLPTNDGRGADGRYIVNDLTKTMWEGWDGLPIEETGILDYLPQLRALVLDQPTLVAFYRPNCGSCHDLFDGFFGERLPARVIAVQVPPADGVELTESDLPDDVYCADCVKLSLPKGPVWLADSPLCSWDSSTGRSPASLPRTSSVVLKMHRRRRKPNSPKKNRRSSDRNDQNPTRSPEGATLRNLHSSVGHGSQSHESVGAAEDDCAASPLPAAAWPSRRR